MGNKFRVSNKIDSDVRTEASSEVFSSGADKSKVDIMSNEQNAKPSRSFTVPLNSYELELLKKVSEKYDRSMRYVSRKLLTKALESDDSKYQL
jgi:hypothetical protein